MVQTDRSLSGTHLLCAVGRYQEACSQVRLSDIKISFFSALRINFFYTLKQLIVCFPFGLSNYLMLSCSLKYFFSRTLLLSYHTAGLTFKLYSFLIILLLSLDCFMIFSLCSYKMLDAGPMQQL